MRLRFLFVLIFSCCLLLATTVRAYALMPADRTLVSGTSEEEAAAQGKKEKTTVTKGAVSEEPSETEKSLSENIRTIKERKKKIIEEVKVQEARRQEKKRTRRRKIASKEEMERIYYAASPLRQQKIEPLNRHNVIVGQNPVPVFATLLVLSLLIYLAYRLMVRKASK